MVNNKFLRFVLYLTIFLIFLYSKGSAYAGNGTISVQPLNGVYTNGETFTAKINIDGGGTPFNASKATVAVSPNLVVEGLTLGDCNFAFVETPSANSLSYAGVILGDSKTSCTVYTLNLRVNGSNNGFIFITDAAIKAYKDAAELFSKANSSSYTFKGGVATSTQPIPTQAPLALNNGIKYYTVVYTVPPVDPRLTVVLDQKLPTEVSVIPAPHPKNPAVLAATFDNVSEGVHKITVLKREKQLSEEIVNIQGDNREISLGVEPKEQVPDYLVYALLSSGASLILLGSVFGYIYYWRKKHTYQ